MTQPFTKSLEPVACSLGRISAHALSYCRFLYPKTAYTFGKNALIYAGLLSLAAALPQNLSASEVNTLVIAKAADPQSLDPAFTLDNNDLTIVYPMYQRLVRYEKKRDETGIADDLAESWSVSDDQLTWVFKIKHGFKFSDGTPVDAKAVEYSFERLFNMGQGPSAAFPKGTSVVATGPLEVTFKLEKPFAPFLYVLAVDGASIVNPNVESQGNDHGSGWLSMHSAGSGAYMLESWERGSAIILKPNPYYSGTKPALQNVRVEIVPEAASRRLRLEAGDVDIAESLPLDQIQTLKKNPDLNVVEEPSLSVTYLYLNNKHKPLDNVDVRRAISYAIDYQAILDGVLSGDGVVMDGPIPEGMWGKSTDITHYSYDPGKAAELISKAGINGSKLKFLYSDRDPLWEPLGIGVQAYLAQLNIDVLLEKLANATLRERIETGDFDIAIGGWSPDFADPYMFMNYWFDSQWHGLAGNRSFYTNPQVDEWLRQAATTSDQNERTQLYAKVQKVVTDEAPYVYLFQRNYMVAMRKNVSGFVYNPMLDHVYNFAEMSKK